VAVPSRAFVGMVVFGLIASLAIVPYTLLVLGGYEPPADAPYWQEIFPPSGASTGDKLALALASLFSIALTVFAWRGLLHGARMDTRTRREMSLKAKQPPPPPPPGYQ
jgi:hypothetical protein